MARAVIYINNVSYEEKAKAKGKKVASLRRNSSEEVVEWLNSLPGTEYQGKKIKELVNFHFGSKHLWECFALVELED